jgi:hypothetical protein
MKKLLTPVFILLALVATAGPNDGILSIINLGIQEIAVEIDGRPYNDCRMGITLPNITPGNHIIKLFVETPAGLGERVPRRTLLQQRTMYVKSRFYVDIVINRFGKMLVDEMPLSEYERRLPPPPPVPVNPNPGMPPRGGLGESPRGGFGDPRPGEAPRGGLGEGNFVPTPVRDENFNAMKDAIARESFDDSRTAIAKSIIDQNFFSSNQAKALVQVFTFERNKLEIAKYLYARTTDKKNYFVVYSCFDFAKSKEELAEYVRTFR